VTILDTASWAAWNIVVPLIASLLAFLFPRGAKTFGLVSAPCISLSVTGLAWQVIRHGPHRYQVGGWGAPLGIDLYVDGLSTCMLVMTAVVGLFISLYAVGYFSFKKSMGRKAAEEQARERAYFWSLWMLLWGALNALFQSSDAFNLYVSLELLGLSAAALTALSGHPAALTAAMRYLLVTMLGSLNYLLGVTLLYAAFGTLDLASLGQLMTSGPVPWTALSLMTVGLLLKTALFPLHFWLPPAHANAPSPVSALLSALVVKASFYLLLRFWFEVFSPAINPVAGQFLGALGAAAIFWGSLQALATKRLKLLVAYSTVAQLGYLFLVFPLAQATGGSAAWSGTVYFVVSHAVAKAAMFLSAGTILLAAGHDRVAGLDGIRQRLPLSVFAFSIAGVTLIGLPPSGAFIAKWMLLTAALTSGQWWWAVIIAAGGLLTAGYVFRVVSRAFRYTPGTPELEPVPRIMEWGAFSLSMIALTLGLAAPQSIALLDLGAPGSGAAFSEIMP
jgi:multicomponent Na+:H+ antiporter subunit D